MIFYLKFKSACSIVTGVEQPPTTTPIPALPGSDATTTTTPTRRARRNANFDPFGAVTISFSSSNTTSSILPAPVNLLYYSDPHLKSYIERRNIVCHVIYSQCSVSV